MEDERRPQFLSNYQVVDNWHALHFAIPITHKGHPDWMTASVYARIVDGKLEVVTPERPACFAPAHSPSPNSA